MHRGPTVHRTDFQLIEDELGDRAMRLLDVHPMSHLQKPPTRPLVCGQTRLPSGVAVKQRRSRCSCSERQNKPGDCATQGDWTAR